MGINSSRLATGKGLRYLSGTSRLTLDRPPADGSYRKCLKSWTYIHNESVNIFSHLIGSLLFFALPFGIYKELAPRYASADRADILVFATFFFGVAICFALSTV
jgi:predicted membrane channel-forming protein YqfA (hemolysin III family)